MKYEQRLENLNLMTMVERRERGDMILAYKILNNKFEISNQLIVKTPSSTTRGPEEITRNY